MRKELRGLKAFVQEVLSQQAAHAAVEHDELQEARTWATTARVDVDKLKKDLKVAVRNLRNEVMEVRGIHRDTIGGTQQAMTERDGSAESVQDMVDRLQVQAMQQPDMSEVWDDLADREFRIATRRETMHTLRFRVLSGRLECNGV